MKHPVAPTSRPTISTIVTSPTWTPPLTGPAVGPEDPPPPPRLPPRPPPPASVEQPRLDRDDSMAIRSTGLLRRLRPRTRPLPLRVGTGHRPPRSLGRIRLLVPQLDAIITGTVNTAKVDRRPFLGEIV